MPTKNDKKKTIAIFKNELATYKRHLAELMSSEGKFVLVKGDEVFGPFDSYDIAIGEGYTRFGLNSFMVTKIEAPGHGTFVTRLVPLCR
ncbi:hypothetical protein BH09SUM1_BH09SUM1_00080 [soil metagenome]